MPDPLTRPVRRLSSLAAACAAVLALVLLAVLSTAALPAGPAAAGKVQVSVDERTWNDELPREIFDSVEHMAPGDDVTDTVWVRNVTAEPLKIAVQMRWAGPEAATALDDVLTVGLNDASATVGQLRQEPLTVSLGNVGPDQVARVDAGAHLPLSAGNSTQREYLQFELVLQLSEGTTPSPQPSDSPSEDPGPEPSSDPSSEPTGEADPPQDDEDARQLPLPRTGAEVLMLAIIGGFVLAAGVAALVATRRRRESDD
ncbi:LPXTG cell wall anchor domain-containing protein [Brevibacterium luteolum]|nr:LPXTG cell wall anchor domain-containing protein [Brevibacterium luteolum]